MHGGSGSGGSIINCKTAVDNPMRHCENFSLHHIKGLHASAIYIVQATPTFLQQCWEDLYTNINQKRSSGLKFSLPINTNFRADLCKLVQ